ncbi:hypothetical protein ZWY2020_011656 [Hordeum vulgare]|nr:hypothetical protein ZWY2020_011656 [Hordeum vulgare]
MDVVGLPGLASTPLAGVVDSGCVLNEVSDLTPSSGLPGSSGLGRQPKKTTGRKPVAKSSAVLAPASAALVRGDLGEALGVQNVGVKAKRSMATPVVRRAPSMRAKAKLGELTSMESAKLRLADKNIEV